MKPMHFAVPKPGLAVLASGIDSSIKTVVFLMFWRPDEDQSNNIDQRTRLAALPATAFKRLDGHRPLIDA
jgi:hypothetical protein